VASDCDGFPCQHSNLRGKNVFRAPGDMDIQESKLKGRCGIL